jgi:anti-anti-sigma factor
VFVRYLNLDIGATMLKLQETESTEAAVRLALSGSLDLAGVMQVESAFVEATSKPGKHAIVDFSQVTFISSLGIAMLIRRNNSLRSSGLRLILLRPNRDVASVFTKAGLTKMLAIAHDEQAISQIIATAPPAESA